MASEIENFLAKTDSDVPKVDTPDSSVSRWYSGQEESSKVGLSFRTAQDIAPDIASRVLKVKSKTGLPEDLIHKNLDIVEKESNVSGFDPNSFLRESPVVAGWASESPHNAAIIKDNLDSFSDIESTMQDYSMLSMLYKNLNSGLSRTYSLVAKTPALIYDIGAIPQNIVAKLTGDKSLEAESPSWLINNPISKYYDEQADAFKTPELDQSIIKNIRSGNFSRAGRILAAQVVANAPQQAAILIGSLAGYGVPTLAGMGALSGAGVIAENKDKPHDPLSLTIDAVLQGTFEAAFESLGTGGILKTWEKAIAKEYGKDISRRVFLDFGKTLFYSAVGEGNEEFVTQLSQDYADYITGINPNALKGTLTRALDAGIIGGASGATMTAPSAIMAGTARGARIRQSTLAKDFYLQLGNKIQKSNILEKSPQTASVLIDRMTKDSPVENVYLTTQALEEKITSLGQDPLKVIQDMGLLPIYNEAKKTGTEMQIPMNQWVVKGNELYQSMADDIKFTPDASSVNQTKVVKEQVQQEAVKAEEAVVQPTQEQTSAAKVGETIVEQLKQAGFEEGIARQYAKVHESAFGTLGSKAGIDPLELFNRYGLQIRRPDVQGVVPQGTTQMEQSPIIPGGESSVVAGQASSLPTEQGLQAQQGTISEIKAMRDRVFPGPVSSHESIALEPDYYKLKADAADVVDRYAKQRGIEANNQFAVSLWQELHDALGSIRTAKEADRLEVAKQVMAKYPTIENDFVTLKEQLWSDATEGYFDKFIKGQYKPKNEDSFYQSAFHGTPHKFDKFSLHHIGTGEGAQSYGWGLYFASKKEVAEGYREQLAGELITTNLKVGDFQVIRNDKLVNILNRYQQGERGVIRFGKDRQFNIDLFKSADLSTFLHESGHLFLEVMADLAELPTANQEIRDDLSLIYKYLGVESRDQIKTEHHEKFARTFEAYLLTAKAPSEGLREAFSRFKSWLLAIYRNVRNLNVPINKEISGVFDRILASQDEIRKAQEDIGVTPLFSDPKSIGMSDAESERYIRAVLDAKTEAEDELTTKLMKEANREQEAWWKTEREKIEKEVSEKVDQSPGLIALYALQHGTLPNGDALPEGLQAIKLSKSAIENNFPDYPIKDFPKPYVYVKEGGIHPDEAAAIFGFKSGSELLFNILTEPNRDTTIKQQTDEIMQARFGDLMKQPVALAKEAKNSIHNDKRAELLRAELQHLASNNLPSLKGLIRKVTKPIPSMTDIRSQAEEIIADKKVRHIHPSLYENAEKNASKEAVDALLKGDIDSAFEAKQRELLNHELFRAATRATDSISKTVSYMAKFNRPSVREKLGKAGEEYLDQIDSILDRFDFRKGISLKAVDRRKALVSWIEDQREEGNEPDISDEVINEAYRQHYKDVTYNVLTGIRDSVKTIEHLASVKNKLLASERLRSLEAARDEIVTSIQAHHKIQKETPDPAPSISKTIIKNVSRFAAYHTRMEFLFQFLDGNKANGSVWETLFKPMAEAENVENKMMKDVSENLHRIFNSYTRQERTSWFLNRQYYREIGSHMTKGNLLVLALNWGNQYNREAILEGYGWSDKQALSLLNNLDERDWKFVQSILDYIDTFWPHAQALERDLNGIAPEKVSPAEIRTKYGTFKGGYYPIVFDKSLSFRQTQLSERESVKEMFGGNSFAAMTKHGHLKARKGTGGAKLLLEFSGLTNHLSDVVHDLSYRRAVIDAHKIINHPDVRFNIEASAGLEMYKQLGPWLHAIAGDRRGEPANPIEGILASARAGATVVNLGLKITSGLVQTLGYLNTVKEIGPKYALSGIRDVYRKPWEISKHWSFITERSEMMRVRIENWDRDIRDAMKKLSVSQQPGITSKTLVKFGADRFAVKLAELQSYSPEMQQSFFSFVGYMDLAMSVPTWMGAYRKAMDGHIENVKPGDEHESVAYADSVVRMTQSAGSSKDNAAIQRGQEAFKIFTMFYSQLSLQFNLFQKSFNQFKLDGKKASLIGALSLLWFIPAVMEDLVRGRPPEGDDEDKYLKWLLRKEMLYPFNTIVLGRDLANAADRYLQTGTKDFQGSPIFDAGSAAIGAFMSLPVKIATGEDITRGDIRDVINTAGYVYKLPSRQIWMTADYLYAWMTGEQTPDNPVEGIFRALVTGRKK